MLHPTTTYISFEPLAANGGTRVPPLAKIQANAGQNLYAFSKSPSHEVYYLTLESQTEAHTLQLRHWYHKAKRHNARHHPPRRDVELKQASRMRSTLFRGRVHAVVVLRVARQSLRL